MKRTMRRRGWWRKREADEIRRGVEAEVTFHLESRVEDLVATGVPESEARRRAETEFGDVASVRAELESIDVRSAARRYRRDRTSVFFAELKRAARAMVREPAFFLVAVVTLTLGLGGAAAIFALVDGIVLRPLPYADAKRLIRIETKVPGVGAEVTWGLAKRQFLFFREQARELDDMGLYRLGSVTMGGDGGSERVRAAYVEPGVATVLGLRSRVGRMIESADNLEPTARVALVSERWAARNGHTGPGEMLQVDGTPVEIVGVLPSDAMLPDELEAGGMPIDIWLPLWLDPAEPARNTHLFRAVGRISPGSDAVRAGQELARLTERLRDALPAVYTPGFMNSSGFRTAVRPLQADVVGGISRVLWMLLAAVGLVLAIASANVANLFLVRAESRRRESAVRRALGASRGDLLSSFCAETLLLALVAGAFALVVATGVVQLIPRVALPGLPRLQGLEIGIRTGGFLLMAAVLLGVVLGIVPYLRGRMDTALLRGEGRSHTSDRRSVSARSVLVLTQFTLALVLLSCAALLLRSFQHMKDADAGLDAAGVHTFSVHVPATGRHTAFASAAVFHRELTERVSAIPGVERAALSDYVPLTGPVGCTVVFSREVPQEETEIAPCVTVASVSPEYFASLGIPVRGEVSDWAAMQNGVGGVIVSHALAQRLWPGRDPIGLTLRANNAREPYYPVVGVAEDVRGEGIDRPPVEIAYFPLVPMETALVSPAPPTTLRLVIRGETGLDELAGAVRSTLARLAPEAALGPLQSMQSIVAGSMARVSFAASLLLLAGLLALLLSAVGIYGVMGFLVRQRQAEIGVRMALGANASQVWRMVVAQSVALAAPGVVLGLALAWLATGTLRSLLYEVQPGDPLAIGGAALTLLAVAVLACAAPARRAATVDPASALHPDG